MKLAEAGGFLSAQLQLGPSDTLGELLDQEARAVRGLGLMDLC